MLTVDCVVPYREVPEVEDANAIDTIDVTVIALSPEMAFLDEQDIEILFSVSPIYNLTSITCLFHDVKV